jgi:hypothetical protein
VKWCSLRRRSGVKRRERKAAKDRLRKKAHIPTARSLTVLSSDGFAKQCAAGPGDRSKSSTAQLDDLEFIRLDVEGTKTPV